MMHSSQLGTSLKIPSLQKSECGTGTILQQPLLLPYSDVINSMEKRLQDRMTEVLLYQFYKSENIPAVKISPTMCSCPRDCKQHPCSFYTANSLKCHQRGKVFSCVSEYFTLALVKDDSRFDDGLFFRAITVIRTQRHFQSQTSCVLMPCFIGDANHKDQACSINKLRLQYVRLLSARHGAPSGCRR